MGRERKKVSYKTFSLKEGNDFIILVFGPKNSEKNKTTHPSRNS
jgi:hypothetical protein